MQARASIVIWAAAALVSYRALASCHHRHFSPAWDFARGHAFLHFYDTLFTYLPMFMLGFVAWGWHRRKPLWAAYGFAWVVVLLVAPPLIAQRHDPEVPVLASYLGSASFVGALLLSIASLSILLLQISQSRKAAA
jgi:hypothetical protein